MATPTEKRSMEEITPVQKDLERDILQQVLPGPPTFRWASLWEPAQINPLNGKSYTLPLLRLTDQYAINFHLAWLGFFVAFLSWFAFPPLMPEAIRADLDLTTAQVGNSNIVALCATLVCRFAIGPFVDRFGPRYTLAGVLVVGAIPSGLAGTISNATGLYLIRFFIGILGATFVPCIAWSTLFFDKNIVGAANAFVGGWGNLGGGVTFVVQVAVFHSLVTARGLSHHSAWRAAFAVVPVPILFFIAILVLAIGTDCPAGKWSARHTLPATAAAARLGHISTLDPAERAVYTRKMNEKRTGSAHVQAVEEDEEDVAALAEIPLDVAVNEPLTFKKLVNILTCGSTWLPALTYMTTFGFELCVDSYLPNVLVANNKLTQLHAGYLVSVFGFMNIVTRPAGGFLGDALYRRYGVKGKKYITIALGFLQGAMALAFGLYALTKYNAGERPSVGVTMALVVLMGIFCEVANGTNFSLVPHCNPFSGGTVVGIVGSSGNLGGIIFAIMFRYLPKRGYTMAWIASGAFAMGINLFCILLPTPKQ
ncbi:hypothetical protein JCM3774_001673 [Rhodotorula dairenensis]